MLPGSKILDGWRANFSSILTGMQKINLGYTRVVFLYKNYAIKIPNYRYGWATFLQGLLANINESTTWKSNTGVLEQGRSHLLCPVLWCSWGGWILVMRKVDIVITDEMGKHIDFSRHYVEFPGDDKPDNYGILNGRLVKLDYGFLL